MSVVKSKRGISRVQFLHTARELERDTKRVCIKAPKRYTFYGLQELWKTSRDIHSNLVMANSIYPTNAHEAQVRIDCEMKAIALIYDYATQLEILAFDNVILASDIERLSNILNDEKNLVKGLLQSDRSRYKGLT